jgi:hypothetical protein
MTGISRRCAVPTLAGAAAALTSLMLPSIPARAQAAAWREYRDEEMGFQVELPGEFKVRREAGEAKDPWVRSIRAKIDIDGMSMDAHGTEYRGTLSAEELYKLQEGAGGILANSMRPTREEQRAVSGVPAREFIREADDTLNYISRMVVVGNRVIGAGVLGERGIHGNPNVRRFLDSLTLLQGGR